MGVFTHESEHNSAIAPARLFKAFVLDGDSLVKKVAPHAITCTETLGADGQTIKKMTFTEGGQCSFMIHSIDEASLSYCHTLTEFKGNTLTDKLEKIESETELVPSGDGGCTVKIVSKYYVVGDVAIVKENVEAGKEKGLDLFKLVEEYLNNHPDSYN